MERTTNEGATGWCVKGEELKERQMEAGLVGCNM